MCQYITVTCPDSYPCHVRLASVRHRQQLRFPSTGQQRTRHSSLVNKINKRALRLRIIRLIFFILFICVHCAKVDITDVARHYRRWLANRCQTARLYPGQLLSTAAQQDLCFVEFHLFAVSKINFTTPAPGSQDGVLGADSSFFSLGSASVLLVKISSMTPRSSASSALRYLSRSIMSLISSMLYFS